MRESIRGWMDLSALRQVPSCRRWVTRLTKIAMDATSSRT